LEDEGVSGALSPGNRRGAAFVVDCGCGVRCRCVASADPDWRIENRLAN
jgi:hypothetical protein